MKIALCLAGLVKRSSCGPTAYINGYSCLKKSILNDFMVDVFIHSWEPEMKDELIRLYNPVDYKLESQIDFVDQYNTLNPLYNQCSLSKYQAVFSMLYGRKMSIQLKTAYEVNTGFKYDIVILSRFDLESAPHILPLIFDRDCNPSCIYTPYFAQTNAGPKDEWIYSSSDNMNYLGSLYDSLTIYMRDDNEFVFACKNGWPISSPDRFSNELFKPIETQSVMLETIPLTHILNTHLLYKWHMLKNNMWNSNTMK